MSLPLRLLLFFTSTGALIFVLRKIRDAQAQIESTVFWILFMLALVVISVFPGIVLNAAKWIGVESGANFVFLCIIFILLLKVFNLSMQISKLQYQIQQLTQRIALDDYHSSKSETDA